MSARPSVSAKGPVIVDQAGNPIKAQTAHYAAEYTGSELARWNPPYRSSDAEWLPEQERVLARVHDQARNNGMIAGGIQTQIDNLVGSGLRLSARPNWRVLGIDDPEVQAEWEDNTEEQFNAWGNDPDCYCDASRLLTVGGMMAQASRTHLINFEALATAEWITDEPGARYRTAIQMVDPMRLSNPERQQDTATRRGGIRYGKRGQPISYFIASRLAYDYLEMGREAIVTWKEYPAYVTNPANGRSWGRRNVLHIYEQERPGQSRGKGGLISVIARGRMLDANEKAHLQAAIQNAIYATTITSPMDWKAIGEALGAGDDATTLIRQYLADREGWHEDSTVMFGDTRVTHLYPGEELKHVNAAHPHASFESFERVFHRYMAAGMNMTYEQFSRDYSMVNYSGHRANLLDYWRFITGRRASVPGKLGSLIFALWLEEAMDKGDVETPAGAPSFWEAKSAWCGCEWIGPGSGQIDPLKEANADLVEDQGGWTTAEIECAKRGRDWRKVYEQRAKEAAHRKAVAEKYDVDPSEIKDGGQTRSPMPAEQELDSNGKPVERSGGAAAKPAAARGALPQGSITVNVSPPQVTFAAGSIQAGDTTVNVPERAVTVEAHMPEAAPPVVINNLSVPPPAAPHGTRTTVEGRDANGDIAQFRTEPIAGAQA